jgi:hypothetical protein
MRRVHVVVLVLVVAAVSLISGWASAQTFGVTPVNPRVLSGADIGFRVEGHKDGTPVGTLVIRVNGEWMPVDSVSGARLLR